MSANNQISIHKGQSRIHPSEVVFLVDNVDVETAGIIERIGESTILEGAVELANKYMEEEEVEYGLDIRV